MGIAQLSTAAAMLNVAPRAAAAMVPLMVSTFIFWLYLQQRHHLMADFLSLSDCCKIDNYRKLRGGYSNLFLFEKYKQPVMKAKHVVPCNRDEYNDDLEC